MPRPSNSPASRARRKRKIKASKGYRGRRSKLFRYAKDAQMKAKYWVYRDRKLANPLPRSLDHASQRCRPRRRHQLQPLH